MEKNIGIWSHWYAVAAAVSLSQLLFVFATHLLRRRRRRHAPPVFKLCQYLSPKFLNFFLEAPI